MKAETVPGCYLLSSLVDAAAGVIRMKLAGKPVRFYTNIMADLPGCLAGDESRMRRILLELLSNAVTFTEKGSIGLSITADRRSKKTVWLKIAVSGTGAAGGIGAAGGTDTAGGSDTAGPGFPPKIFEGTELAAAQELCRDLGGTITVENPQGPPGTVTALVPQGIYSPEPFAAVDSPERKQTLIYEARLVYANSVCWSLEQLGIPYTLVTNIVSFATALYRWDWHFVFSGYGLYEQIQPLMEREEAFVRGKRLPLALMAEWGTRAYIPGVRSIFLPVQPRSIAAVLDGKPGRDYTAEAGFDGPAFTVPGVDVDRGIAMTGGTEAGYRQVLSVFRGDAEERLALLRSLAAKSYLLKPDDLPRLTAQAHALKSAAASLGAADISAQAAGLEASGKAGDIAAIRKDLPGFIENLGELTSGIGAALGRDGTGGAALSETRNPGPQSAGLLKKLGDALEAQNFEDIDLLLEELLRQDADSQTKEAIARISEDILMAEYGQARDAVQKLIQKTGQG